MSGKFRVQHATSHNINLVLSFIKELAAYEKLSHEVVVNENDLKKFLFGEKKYAEVIIGMLDNEPVSFALFFHNFSTFLGRPGIYLEDLFVKEKVRGQGIGNMMLTYLANLALERNCGRLEWWVLDWNKPAIDFYEKLNARAMDEWTVYRLSGEALLESAKSWQTGEGRLSV